VCGPPRYAEMRINLSQAFNGIGTVVAPVLGSYVFFTQDPNDPKALQNVQFVYLAIGIFTLCLAVVFYFSPIPEITDADMEFQALETHVDEEVKPFNKQYRLFHAAFAQFCYTGAQIAVASYFINYVVETRAVPVNYTVEAKSAVAAKFLAGAQGAFALGRFIGVVLMKFIRARKVFLFYMTMVVIFCIPSIVTRDNAGMSMLFVVLFFESIVFPTIVALGMRGLGKYTKRGSGLIIAGVSGGAIVPPLTGRAADLNSTAIAMSVPLMFFVAAWTYAAAVNFVPRYRDMADKFSMAKIGIEGPVDVETGSGSAEEAALEKGEADNREHAEVGSGEKVA
jgi:FHS family L-fucose permease-like MFS transporter